jgi:predicted aspartyl protease
MGLVDVKLRVANPAAPDRAAELEVLVGTGTTLSSIPRPFLENLGIEPGMVRTFRLAGGSRVHRETGSVLATLDGVTMPVPVMFGGENDAPVLGATALEILGFAVDPLERKTDSARSAGIVRQRDAVPGGFMEPSSSTARPGNA